VLTAIVISFGMTAVVVMMALGAFLEGGDDRVDMPRADRPPDSRPGTKAHEPSDHCPRSSARRHRAR
jgi:multicomponent K+:H+ antiporter subunit C